MLRLTLNQEALANKANALEMLNISKERFDEIMTVTKTVFAEIASEQDKAAEAEVHYSICSLDFIAKVAERIELNVNELCFLVKASDKIIEHEIQLHIIESDPRLKKLMSAVDMLKDALNIRNEQDNEQDDEQEENTIAHVLKISRMM